MSAGDSVEGCFQSTFNVIETLPKANNTKLAAPHLTWEGWMKYRVKSRNIMEYLRTSMKYRLSFYYLITRYIICSSNRPL